jgi:hypothetical protein
LTKRKIILLISKKESNHILMDMVYNSGRKIIQPNPIWFYIGPFGHVMGYYVTRTPDPANVDMGHRLEVFSTFLCNSTPVHSRVSIVLNSSDNSASIHFDSYRSLREEIQAIENKIKAKSFSFRGITSPDNSSSGSEAPSTALPHDPPQTPTAITLEVSIHVDFQGVRGRRAPGRFVTTSSATRVDSIWPRILLKFVVSDALHSLN